MRVDHRQQENVRLQGVEMVLGGMIHVDVAEELGVHPHSIDHWMAIYRNSGKEGLRWNGNQGRQSLLSEE